MGLTAEGSLCDPLDFESHLLSGAKVPLGSSFLCMSDVGCYRVMRDVNLFSHVRVCEHRYDYKYNM